MKGDVTMKNEERRRAPIWGLGYAALLLFVCAGLSQAQGLFDTPVHYDVGSRPRDVTAADLDRDGSQDLVVANSLSSTVSVLLNGGDGTFGPALSYPVGASPYAAVTARMDADLYPDVIASGYDAGTISVLLNDGAGGLLPAVHYPVGDSPMGLVAVDLSGDGIPDVAVVNRESRTFSVLVNDGTGALTLSAVYAASGFSIKPSWITAGDFDGDEAIDLAVVKNYHNLYFTAAYVQVFPNDGTGHFPVSRTYDLGAPGTATTPMAADFDGDEDIDLIASGFVVNSYRVSVLLNDGTGNFADPLTYSAGASGRACYGDFDFDQDLDLAVSEQGVSSYSFSVLENNGDATFESPYTVAVGPDPMGIVSRDFDSDGDGDLAVAVFDDDSVAVVGCNADPTAVGGGVIGGVDVLRLYRAHPNPFASETALAFELSEPARVAVRIYDVSGRLVRTLTEGEFRAPGRHELTWDGRDGRGLNVASGVYLCRTEASGAERTQRMVLIR
jgi:hypothetical protein